MHSQMFSSFVYTYITKHHGFATLPEQDKLNFSYCQHEITEKFQEDIAG